MESGKFSSTDLRHRVEDWQSWFEWEDDAALLVVLSDLLLTVVVMTVDS